MYIVSKYGAVTKHEMFDDVYDAVLHAQEQNALGGVSCIIREAGDIVSYLPPIYLKVDQSKEVES